MLKRYHLVSMAGIFLLGVIGNYAMPMLVVPLPWTVFLLIVTGAMTSAVFAFAGAARYSSPTLAAENIRLSRFPEPIKYASDGRLLWAGVPCKGWRFIKTFINSGSNPGIAIMPAVMLEQESERYTIARCKLYHLTDQAVRVLSRKRAFGQLLKDLGYSEEKKMEVYFGFHGEKLHPDALHIRSPRDLNAYWKMISKAGREYRRTSFELEDSMKKQLETWNRITGSGPAQIVVRREQEGNQ